MMDLANGVVPGCALPEGGRGEMAGFMDHCNARSALLLRASSYSVLGLSLAGLASFGCARAPDQITDAGPAFSFPDLSSLFDSGAGDASEVQPKDDGSLSAQAPSDAAQHQDAETPAPQDGGSQTQGAADGSQADASPSVSKDAEVADAGPVSECRPGTYAGTFKGQIKAKILGIELPLSIKINGDISIDAQTSDPSSSDLVIQNGSISGEDADGNPVQAEVTGSLNCNSKQLENGTLTNGVYTRTAIGQTVTFSGTVTATYQPGDPPSVAGNWKTESGFEAGSGTFQATWQAP
jgi:hypothetical protein